MEDNYVRVIIALCGTATGAVGLKLLDKWMPDATKRTDDQAALRKELRDDASGLRKELREAIAQYQLLYAQHVKLNYEHAELKAQYSQLQAAYKGLEATQKQLEAQFSVLTSRCDNLLAIMRTIESDERVETEENDQGHRHRDRDNS